jgi:large subunit ribosomal protein L35
MPKQKTKKILIKRFRVTKNGKVMRGQSFRRHLNAKKTASRKRRLGKVIITKKVMSDRIKKILGK